MSKKSHPTRWAGLLLVVGWMARTRVVAYVLAGGMALFVVAARFAPPPPPAAVSAAPVPPPAPTALPPGRLNLDFTKLNFYLPPDVRSPFLDNSGFAAYLPAEIKRYDGRDIRISGYMLPTVMEGGRVRECLVLPNQLSCCFGLEPRFCQFIDVRFTGPAVTQAMDTPLRFEGRLRVGDVFAESSWVALYSMNCTAVDQ